MAAVSELRFPRDPADRRALWRELIHQPPREQPVDRVVVKRVASASDLIAAAQAKLEGDVLRYSERLKLLRIAREAGIDRFDANLIIAAEQNRAAVERRLIAPAPSKQRAALRTPMLWVLALVALEMLGLAAMLAR